MASYRHCITESSADRQRQIENALLELMKTRAFAQISIQDICDQVGLSRKSFYRYFSSKEMCLTALVDHTILDYRTEPILDKTLADALTHYFRYWRNQRPLVEALDRERMVDILVLRSIASVEEDWEFYQGVSGWNTNMSQKKAVFLVSGLVSLLLHWHREGYQASPEQMSESVQEFLPFRGVF